MTPSATAQAPRARRAPGPARRVTPALAAGAPARTAPAVRPRRAQPKRSRPAASPPLPRSAVRLILALPEHRLLDRLIRGRMWIGLVAFSLIGIVAMQLLVLELNTGIGRSLQHEAQLQAENATLSVENSTATSGENIEPAAAHRGMELAPVGAVHFLRAGDHYVASAAERLRHPIPSSPTAPTTEASGEASTQTPPSESSSAEPATGEQSSTATAETPSGTSQAPPPTSAESSSEPETSPQSQPASAPSVSETASSPSATADGGTQADGQG